MAKTHKQHLAQYGYKPTVQDPYNNKESERAWQTLVKNNGEDNVWDYRILDEAFDTSKVDYAWGIMLGAVKRDTGETGNVSQTDFMASVPRFYFDFRPASGGDDE